MKTKRSSIDPFNLAFLDIISCGFGAVVLLILIFSPFQGENDVDEFDYSEVLSELSEYAALKKQVDSQRSDYQSLKSKVDSEAKLLVEGRQTETELRQKLIEANRRADELAALIASENAAKNAQLAAKRAAAERAKRGSSVPTEAGGIPVDRKYIVFVVDTSGSMKDIWPAVTDQVKKILDVHPEVSGINVVNDNGFYLINGYAKGWIPDTPQWRKRLLGFFRNFNATSSSDPTKGVRTILRDYRVQASDMAIYVLGDDFSGGDIDSSVRQMTRENSGARINAFSFVSPRAQTDRFSTVMRELSQRNDGAFLAIDL